MSEGNLCDENPSHSLDKQQTEQDVSLTNEEYVPKLIECQTGCRWTAKVPLPRVRQNVH